MAYEPIKRLEIANYGCIRSATFNLTPLHALIGPNDSGKSTALRALRTIAQLGAGDFGVHGRARPLPFDPKIDASTAEVSIAIHYRDHLAYELRVSPTEISESVRDGARPIAQSQGRGWNLAGLLKKKSGLLEVATIDSRLGKATMVRFDAESLAAPSSLIPDNLGIAFADERGTGLAGVFDAIVNRDAEAFSLIQANVRALFPSVSRLGLINVSNTEKKIAITLAGGGRIGAESLSEGLLYYLGFAALAHVDAPRLLLIEEPENGLHPARVSEVMKILREVSKNSQVLIATHSPLVVNELDGSEVSVVTRDTALGTRAILLQDVPGFEEAAKIYAPGEFWVSYADGEFEEPLLTGKPRK